MTNNSCSGCDYDKVFLYPQILYEGKTNRCHPLVRFPEGWDVSHTPNHWSNEASMIQYLQTIVIPF